jgi:3-hydroxybutyryl-CoA dehydrogenase
VTVAVIGAGTMGAGIGVSLALSGERVTIVGRRDEGLARARRQIEASLALLAEHGRIEEAPAVELSTDLAGALADAELVVETIVEEQAAKRRVLADIAALAPTSAVIATNTSSLSLELLAQAVEPAERFAGMHWLNPAELVELVEISPAPQTAPATTERLYEWALAAGKRPIRIAAPVSGFVANRLQYALIREAYALVRAGVCDLEAIDTAVTAGLGPRWAAVGPFESMDLAGLDVHLAVATELFPTLDIGREPPEALRAAVAEGRLGAKSGAGLRGSYDATRTEQIARRRAASHLR